MRIDISNRIGTTSNFGGFRGLLDKFSGAAAAYSLRKLSKATTSVVRVRRDSDNAEADFTALEITDGTLEAWVNTEYTFFSDTFDGTYTWNTVLGSASVTGGVLDFPNTSTTVTFVSLGNTIRTQQVRVTFTILNYVSGTIRFENFNNGASGTLRSGNGTYTEILTISSSGNNNFGFTGDMQGQIDNLVIEQLTSDGLVTTWYDQSGNANNATQATASAQPKIVSAGVYLGHVECRDGVADMGLTSTYTYDSTIPFTSFMLVENYGNAVFGATSDTGFYYGVSTNGASASSYQSFSAISYQANNVAIGLTRNDVHDATTSFAILTTLATISSNKLLRIGYAATIVNRSRFKEVIVYNSQSTDESGIEANINNYYNIY